MPNNLNAFGTLRVTDFLERAQEEFIDPPDEQVWSPMHPASCEWPSNYAGEMIPRMWLLLRLSGVKQKFQTQLSQEIVSCFSKSPPSEAAKPLTLD
jgi:hypothetical protein